MTSTSVTKEFKEGITFNLGAKAITSLSYISSDPEVAAVDANGTVTIKGIGTATITVKAASDPDYRAARKQVTVTITKVKKAQKITAASTYNRTYKYKRTFSVTAEAEGKISYASTDKSIITVNSSTGLVTVKGLGKAYIKVTAAATEDYKKATKTIVINILPPKKSFTTCNSPSKGILKLGWKKNGLNTGYELQLATNPEFTGKKTAKAGVNQISTTVQLESGTTYYVRIRGYKTNDAGTVYSVWSDVAQVTIK